MCSQIAFQIFERLSSNRTHEQVLMGIPWPWKNRPLLGWQIDYCENVVKGLGRIEVSAMHSNYPPRILFFLSVHGNLSIALAPLLKYWSPCSFDRQQRPLQSYWNDYCPFLPVFLPDLIKQWKFLWLWSNPERQDMSFTLFVLRVFPVYWYYKVSIAMLSFNSNTDLSTLHWDFSFECVWG